MKRVVFVDDCARCLACGMLIDDGCMCMAHTDDFVVLEWGSVSWPVRLAILAFGFQRALAPEVTP